MMGFNILKISISFNYGHPRHGEFPDTVYLTEVPAQNVLLTPTTQDVRMQIKLRKHCQLAVFALLCFRAPFRITGSHIPV